MMDSTVFANKIAAMAASISLKRMVMGGSIESNSVYGATIQPRWSIANANRTVPNGGASGAQVVANFEFEKPGFLRRHSENWPSGPNSQPSAARLLREKRTATVPGKRLEAGMRE